MTLPTTTASTTFDPCTPKPLSAQEQCEAEHREAAADCQQMERNIKLMAEQDQLSFQEYLQKSHIKSMWEAAKNHFIATREALAAVQNTPAVAS